MFSSSLMRRDGDKIIDGRSNVILLLLSMRFIAWQQLIKCERRTASSSGDASAVPISIPIVIPLISCTARAFFSSR